MEDLLKPRARAILHVHAAIRKRPKIMRSRSIITNSADLAAELLAHTQRAHRRWRWHSAGACP
jgi:hypothetical protein